MIRILTDSASDILPAEAEQLGVTVIPLNVTLEDGTVLRDGIDKTPSEYYALLKECHKLPTTSQPSPELFERFYQDAAAAGDEVLGIFLSHELSGTCQCARLAADMANVDNVLFVDSENVCLGESLLVRLAVQLRDAGKTAGQIAATLEHAKEHLHLVAAIDDLKYLRKGGRLPAAVAVAGGMLGIVCDGMGGHLRGDCASCVVAQEFAAVFAESGVEDIPERLTEALHAANRALAAIQKEPEESGTTLLAVFIRGHSLWWISVGDSPLYLWSGADSFRMDRLNEDHSMRPIADCLYRKGEMSLQGALRQRCVLRSAVMGGAMELVDISAMPLLLHPGDAVLACSDGLQVWSELLREPSFLALQKARDCSSRELVGTIMEQVKDMLEPQQDNASVWAAVMRKPCTDGK